MTQIPHFEILLAVGVVVLAIGRALLERRGLLEGTFGVLARVELGVIAALLAGLMGLGVLQIILRNFFHGGLLWADPVMRHIVLWLAGLGAALATARVRHISIDIFGRILPGRFKPAHRTVIYSATAAATYVLAIAALRLVVDERDFGEMAFGSVPIWTLQTVLPWSFLVMSYRSVVNLLVGREADTIAESSLEAVE